VGPSLASFEVPAPLANPTLYLFDHTGALIAANDNWKQSQQTQIQAMGLAPPNNLDAAILITLSPGAYTVFLQGKAMATGIGLAEVYDVDPSANAQPTNLSACAFVGTGNDVLIGGTIIRGNGTSLLRVLVRALGPSLASAGVTTPLANPTLPLRDANGNVIASNDNWKIHSRQLLRRLVRHPRTIMNRPSLGCSHRETTTPSLPEETELRVLP
jgi:hypothetical protein